ncbi:MAG TPA: hypothetical protein VF583_11600 [Bradyrhizobium sp.]
MPIKRSTAIALAGCLFATALNLAKPAAAQSSADHSAKWGALFRTQVAKCWRKPAPAGDEAANMKLVLEIKLTREGSLAEQPSVSSQNSPAVSDYSQAYRKSALQAITLCQPYSLPAEYYDEWKYFMPVFLEMPSPLGGKGKPAAGEPDKRKLSICRGC